MKRVIGGVGGVISGLFIALSTLADVHDISELSVSLLGNHTPTEWAEMATGFAYVGVTGFVVTAVSIVVITLIESFWSKY